MGNIVSWLTNVPVNDINWKSNADRATLEELEEALAIAKEISQKEKGQITRIKTLERRIKKIIKEAE